MRRWTPWLVSPCVESRNGGNDQVRLVPLAKCAEHAPLSFLENFFAVQRCDVRWRESELLQHRFRMLAERGRGQWIGLALAVESQRPVQHRQRSVARVL